MRVQQGHHNHADFKKAQTTVEFLLGPIKIKDGLFMGDQLAARDIEFIITNKVTHVINTVSKAVPNLYQRFGVQYLSVHWTQKEENIFDRKGNAANAIFSFVQEAMQQGQSCLIHSLHGKSRACAVLACYLMRKYSWSLAKTLELINGKKEGLEIRNNYLVQMQELEKRMLETQKLSSSWHEVHGDEDLLLANTFFNTKRAQPAGSVLKKTCRKKVVWDQKLHKTNAPNLSATMTRFKEQQVGPQRKEPGEPLRSILKGFPNEEEQQNQKKQKDFSVERDEKLVNNINGNIVHVTVNNFITTEKKVQSAAKVYNTRPFSSDTKDRQKKIGYDVKPSKLFGYDTYTSNIKNAYEDKLTGKIGVYANQQNKGKKKEEPKPFLANERPQSANMQPQLRKGKTGPGVGLLGRQEMMVTGLGGTSSNKKRTPVSITKQQLFKLK